MPKRLTDTEKWDDSWFMDLPNDMKFVWLYLVDKCNHAGIWKINFKLMKYHLNIKKTQEEIEECFKNKVILVGNDKWFIPNFIKFQYSNGLGSQKPVIVSVRNELNKYGLLLPDNTIQNNHCLMITQSLPNDSVMIKSKSKSIDKDKSINKDKDKDKDFRENLLEKLKMKTKQNKDVIDLLKDFSLDELNLAMINWAIYNVDSAKRNYCFSCNWKNFYEKIGLFIDLNEVNALMEKEGKKNTYDPKDASQKLPTEEQYAQQKCFGTPEYEAEQKKKNEGYEIGEGL